MTTVTVSPVSDLPGGQGRERLARTRDAAERCLSHAARRAGIEVTLERDASGLPRAAVPGRFGLHRVCVSFSGTRGLAAAALSPHPVGVDVEWLGRTRLRPVRESAADDELLVAGTDTTSLIRLWTAKEALLKKLGIGLAGLSRCRLVDRELDRDGTHRLALLFDTELHRVVSRELDRFGGHSVSVAAADGAVEFLELVAEAVP